MKDKISQYQQYLKFILFVGGVEEEYTERKKNDILVDSSINIFIK